MVRAVTHFCGGIGAAVVAAFVVGLMVPPAEEFPDSLFGAFHTFFLGILLHQEGLPDEHDPDWMEKAEPGDVLFVSRGHVAWGQWSHVAVVVRAPPDAFWVEPGTLAVVEAGIHDGMYLAPLDNYSEWPRVVVRRASRDPAVRARIAAAALTHRTRIFASVAMEGTEFSNCTKSATDSLASVGLDAGITGWRTPDELFRSDVWLP